MYHPKANPIKDVYAALMRRQMQWSHLISDKWAPRFHSLWSRSSFLVSTFPFFVKETMCVVTFQPFKFVVREQKHNIEQELFMREITYYLCPQCWPKLSEFTFFFQARVHLRKVLVILKILTVFNFVKFVKLIQLP